MQFFLLTGRRKSSSKPWTFFWYVCSVVFVYLRCLFCCIVRKTILKLFCINVRSWWHFPLVVIVAALVWYLCSLFILLFMSVSTLFWCIPNLVEFCLDLCHRKLKLQCLQKFWSEWWFCPCLVLNWKIRIFMWFILWHFSELVF